MTRRTVVKILCGIDKNIFSQFKNNPEEFINKAAEKINSAKNATVITHISYEPTDECYTKEIFENATFNGNPKLFVTSSKSLFDKVICDSGVEKNFAKALENAEEVTVYTKLPRSFKIETPAGKYSPDWAIAFKTGDVNHIYFVAETKGASDEENLRGVELEKIACARKHFDAVAGKNISYDVVDSFQELMSKLKVR